ncbi:MAG: glycosyltransferase [Nanoarchaeota archaeon]|nr:glycosyltransferase [Nanoarchaeota archaeon]
MAYKIALLHDYLNQYGGAERVLEALLEMFPEADLYTLFYDEKRMDGMFKKNIRKTSFLDLPFVRQYHRAFIPLMPFAAQTMTIDNDYDLIISSSAGYAKGFNISHRHGHRPLHISYCHTPLRYAWESDYLEKLPGVLRFGRCMGGPIRSRLMAWDKKASEKVDVFIANSEFIRGKINTYYGREAEVVYPPVDTERFFFEEKPEKEYYLMAGRLIYYKRFDLGIQAARSMGRALKIAGIGPEEKNLRSIAKGAKNIEFLGRVPDSDLRKIYAEARGLIFPQVEDFGLVAAEAQASGLPVIVYDRGGAKEIVEDKKTGVLFKEQSEEGVKKAIEEFEDTRFERKYIAERAMRFSKDIFKNRIRKIINTKFPISNFQ